MSRLNTFKNTKAKDIAQMNRDSKFQAQKRSDKARQIRTNQFDKNRDITEVDLKEVVKLTTVERTQELMEWRKKKEMEKQKKSISKKPFLPSGPSNKADTTSTKVHNSKTVHNSITLNTSLKKTPFARLSRQNSNPTTNTKANTRVTRSQLRREKEEQDQATTTSLPISATRPTYVVDEQDLAWIPENDLEEINLKVRRKSLRFTELFSKTARSPFVFRANQEVCPPRPAIPTILEDSVEISPITAPAVINRNLLGAFSLIADDTDTLPLQEDYDCEVDTNDNDVIQADLPSKITKEVKITEPTNSLILTPAPFLEIETSTESQAEVPNLVGIDFYSNLLQNTTDDLMSQRDRWQATLTTLTEACDSIRVAIGHTDLLLNKKFRQYSGIIQDASDNPGNLDLETRCSDLQGFWDLILREVEDMQSKYGKLIRMAENGYEAVKSTHKLDRKPRKRVVHKLKKESTNMPRVTRASSVSLREQMMRGREQLKEQQNVSSVIIMTQQKD